MENVTYLGGKAELAIGELVIEPQFLGDMTVTFQEGTRTSTSLAGTINRPSGQIETAQIEGNFIYPHVVGNSVGLPSIWVLVAVTIGANLMGIVGMLIFIPLISVVYTLLRGIVNRRLGLKE